MFFLVLTEDALRILNNDASKESYFNDDTLEMLIIYPVVENLIKEIVYIIHNESKEKSFATSSVGKNLVNEIVCVVYNDSEGESDESESIFTDDDNYSCTNNYPDSEHNFDVDDEDTEATLRQEKELEEEEEEECAYRDFNEHLLYKSDSSLNCEEL